jgi:hypothetical protein
MATTLELLRAMVNGAYDLQVLRMQSGNRLCGNFRHKLFEPNGKAEQEDDKPEKLSEEAKKLIDLLKISYRRLTDGVARNRTLPALHGFFTGDELISTFTELVLVDQYLRIERDESTHFRQLESILDTIPIYTEYLKHQRGVGPAMAAVMVSYFNPHKARHISSFWKYGGLDVADDGAGRSRRTEHLVERSYTTKDGEQKTRMGVTFNPFLRTKLLGVLATSFLRSASPWRKTYDDYKHRLETDPERVKVTIGEWKKRRKAGEDIRRIWPPGRIHRAALRYMVKAFIAELWVTWRKLEGLPVTEPYAIDKLGMRAHGRAA